MKCCIYSRIFFDSPYINAFIEHYLSIGFDKIFLLHADNLEYIAPREFSDRVFIKKVKNTGDLMLSRYSGIVKKHKMDWALCIDSDEFLFLNKKFNNIKDFINLMALKYPRVSAFHFRWLMMEKYDNFNIENFAQLIDKYAYRSNKHIKTMSKVRDLIRFAGSHGSLLSRNFRLFEGKMNRNRLPSGAAPLKPWSYNQACLLHLHTRSIKGIIIKALETKFRTKSISDLSNFKKLLEQQDDITTKNLFKKFKKIIGTKATLPFKHFRQCRWHKKNKIFEKYSIPPLNFKLIDEAEEDRVLKILFDTYDIDYESFQKLEDRISRFVYDKKIFHKK